ncbi:MAG: NAD(+) synthase [Petrotogales bacterium]
MEYKKIVENIRRKLKKYLRTNNLKSLVIGVSGGIDSAVCCALAKPVCDELGVILIGRSLPIESNKQDEIDRAKMVGECFCHDFKEVRGLGKPYNVLEERIHTWEHKANDNIAKGNIKARLRMIYLYNVAGMNNGLVLSTDNYTELLLGFWTLHGDVGDLGMVQNLWKTEVYALANYLVDELDNDRAKEALRACTEADPTDGLGISENDLEQIGADSYEEVDMILQDYLGGSSKYINHPVIQRYEKTHFKRNIPICLKRSKILL